MTAVREFTSAERALLNRGQVNLTQQRRNAAESLAFERELRTNEQPKLFRLKPVPLAVQEAPQPPIQQPVIEASITKALKALPKLGTPEELARKVTESAREPLITRLLERGLAKRFVRKDRLRRDLRVYQALVWAGYEFLKRQGVSQASLEAATSITFFTVAEALTVACDMGTTAVDETLRDLRRTDLIATHRTYQQATFHSKLADEHGEVQRKPVTMNAVTGMWVCLNLRPSREGRVILHHQDLPRDEQGTLIPPRDLKADRKAGRTAWQLRQEYKSGESVSQKEGKEKIEDLLLWSLPLKEFQEGSCVASDRPLLRGEEMDAVRDAVYAAHSAHPQRRRELVQVAATVIGNVLDDQHKWSHKGYLRMVWRSLSSEAEQYPAIQGFLHAIERTLVFKRESQHAGRPLRRPGAYLRAVLAESSWWNAVYCKTVFQPTAQQAA